ncbi:hypothetical protein Bca101_020331 [Brassica carinata]
MFLSCGKPFTFSFDVFIVWEHYELENDNHVFKWVDEAFTDEIQQLDCRVRLLEEEVQFLKATIRGGGELGELSEGPKIMPKIKISGGCVILTVVLVLGILMYKN